MRYSDKDGQVAFDDFVAAYIKLKSLFGKSVVAVRLYSCLPVLLMLVY